MQMKPTNQQTSTQLLLKAKEAAAKAYAPYSKFSVGAALITDDGQIFTGCNVENASYGLTLCAERNAISSMVAAGYTKFVSIAIVAEKSTECYPCGACRQWLYEFGQDANVVVQSVDGEPIYRTVKELLPEAFGPEYL